MKQIFLIIGILLFSFQAGATTLTLVTLESPPAEFTLNGKSTGRNVEIAQECLKRMGFSSIVKIIPWKRALIMVENEMNINKLIAKRFDVFVGVKLTILNLSKKMGYTDDIQIVPMTKTKKPYLLSSSKTYVAFSKQTMTKDIAIVFSTKLKEMIADGTIERIEKSYY